MLDKLRKRLTFRDEPADEYLTPDRHVADDAVMLADGTHLAMPRLDGKPLGLLDKDARYAEHRRRHALLGRPPRPMSPSTSIWFATTGSRLSRSGASAAATPRYWHRTTTPPPPRACTACGVDSALLGWSLV